MIHLMKNIMFLTKKGYARTCTFLKYSFFLSFFFAGLTQTCQIDVSAFLIFSKKVQTFGKRILFLLMLCSHCYLLYENGTLPFFLLWWLSNKLSWSSLVTLWFCFLILTRQSGTWLNWSLRNSGLLEVFVLPVCEVVSCLSW